MKQTGMNFLRRKLSLYKAGVEKRYRYYAMQDVDNNIIKKNTQLFIHKQFSLLIFNLLFNFKKQNSNSSLFNKWIKDPTLIQDIT